MMFSRELTNLQELNIVVIVKIQDRVKAIIVMTATTREANWGKRLSIIRLAAIIDKNITNNCTIELSEI